MKRNIAIILSALMLAASLVACAPEKNGGINGLPSTDNNVENNETNNDLSALSLEEIMDKLYVEAETEFMVMSTPLDEENFEFFSFVPYAEGYEAVASEAAMSAIPHSVVLVRVPEGENAKEFADTMRENANPRKWVCVEAERTTVANSENLVLLVMSTDAISQRILDNFKYLTGAEIPESVYSIVDVPTDDEFLTEEDISDPAAMPEDNQEQPTDDIAPIPEVEVTVPEIEVPAVNPETTPEILPEVLPEVQPEDEQEPEAEVQPEDDQEPETEVQPEVTDKAFADMSFEEIVEVLYSGGVETPMNMTMPLDSENFEFFSFVPYKDTYVGAVNEPMMGSFAHSVVMVRLPEGEDVSSFAKQMKDNADPRKWICVEAEQTTVVSSGNFVMLVMASADNSRIILDNFKALAPDVITH